MDNNGKSWSHQPLTLIFFGLLGSLIHSGCSGSSGSAESGKVTISGEVSLPSATSSSLSRSAGGALRFAEEPAVRGTVTCFSESGRVLGTVQVDDSGAYSLTVRAGSVEDSAISCVYEDEANPGQFPLHSLDQIGEGEETATLDINPRTDFSTAMYLAMAESRTGEDYAGGDGNDLTEAVAVVRPDAYRMFTTVVGDTDISSESAVTTADMALEAVFEAYQFCLLTGEGGEAPLIIMKDALNNDASAQADIQSCLSEAGGGILIDSTLFETARNVSDPIFYTYADTSNDAATELLDTIVESVVIEEDLKAYIDPIVETDPDDLPNLEYEKIRNCVRYIPELGASAFAASNEPGQVIVQTMKQGNCDDPDIAKLIMAACAATLPECPDDGDCDFSSYDPTIAALACSNVGLDLWNLGADPDQFDVKELADTYATQLRNPNNQQSCALVGTAACSNVNQAIVDGESVADVEIPSPPGANCAVGTCAAGTSCTTQSDGIAICAPLSDKLSKFCSSSADCDSLTYCPPAGRCCLRVGAPTGAFAVGDDGQTAQVGGSGSGAFNVADNTASGGRCDTGVCATGLVCRADICIPAGGGDIRTGLGSYCSAELLCGANLRCENGVCKAISAGTNLQEGASCGLPSDCESTCCMGGMCVKNSACTTGGNAESGAAGSSCTVSSTCPTGFFCGRRKTASESGFCVANGTGQAGDFCEVASTTGASCMPGLTCTASVCVAETSTDSGGSGSGTGGGTSGTPDTSCTSTTTCQTGYYCGRRYSATANGQCIANGTGQAGQFCEGGTSCMTGLTCTQQTCVAETSSTSNTACTQSGTTSSNACTSDGQCCSNYCGGTSGNRTCRAAGSGTNGDVCTMNGNCEPGKECRPQSGNTGSNICQIP